MYTVENLEMSGNLMEAVEAVFVPEQRAESRSDAYAQYDVVADRDLFNKALGVAGKLQDDAGFAAYAAEVGMTLSDSPRKIIAVAEEFDATIGAQRIADNFDSVRKMTAAILAQNKLRAAKLSRAEKALYSSADRVQYAAAAAVEISKPIIEKTGEAAEAVLARSSDAIKVAAEIRKDLEDKGTNRDYRKVSPLPPIEITVETGKKLVVGSLLASTVMGGMAQLSNHAAESPKAPSHTLSQAGVAELPLTQMLSNTKTVSYTSPANKAAAQKPGSETTPVSGDQRAKLVEQARQYAHSLMVDGQKQAVKHEISKATVAGNIPVIHAVDGFVRSAVQSLVKDPTVPLTPSNMTVAAEQVANAQLVVRYPGSIQQPELTDFQKTTTPLITKALFSSTTDTFSPAEQASVATAVSSAIESLLPADKVNDFVNQLTASADTQPVAPILPTVSAPAPSAAPSVPSPEASTPASPEAIPQGAQLDIEHYQGIAWSKEDLAKIQANLAVYQQAATAYDLPWEFLAVIHKREHNLALSNPDNGQGIYQFYAEAGAYPAGDVSHDEFLRQTTLLAKRIRDDYSQRGMKDTQLTADSIDAQKVMDTFGRYNGLPHLYRRQAEAQGYSAEQAFMGSPYVVNMLSDAQNSAKNPNWQQYLGDGGHVGPANQQPGAWVAFKELLSVAGDSSKLVNEIQPPAPAATCAEGTDDLGVNTIYVHGDQTTAELCAIPDLPSSGAESDPTSRYYIQGANGHAIVNAEVSAQFESMVVAAKHDGIDLSAISSFRTHAHQQDLCDANSQCSGDNFIFVAKPGNSNHEGGHAVDFLDTNAGNSDNCTGAHLDNGKCVAPDDARWVWLNDNADKFGLGQLSQESWHFSDNGK